MLTAAEIAAMRETAESALPDSAVIYSRSWASDGGGGGTTTWTAAGTVDCRLAPVRGDEAVEGERVTANADSIITVPQTTAVTTDSRIVTGGGTFNVEAIRSRSWEITKRLMVAKES